MLWALPWWPHQLYPHHLYSGLASPIVCRFYQQKFTPWKLCCGLGFMLTPSGFIKAANRIVTHYPMSTTPAYWNLQGKLCDNTALATCVPKKTTLWGWKMSTICLHNIWVQMWPLNMEKHFLSRPCKIRLPLSFHLQAKRCLKWRFRSVCVWTM